MNFYNGDGFRVMAQLKLAGIAGASL